MNWEQVMAPNYGTPRLHIQSANGSRIVANGKEYLDLLGGIATQALGHGNTLITNAAKRQMETLTHVSNLYAHEPGVTLARMLQERTYGHKVLFVNSGTEANEVALKLVRRKAHLEQRNGHIIAFTGSFHGRTTGALSLTGQPKHRESFSVESNDIIHVPFNDVEAFEKASHGAVGIFFELIQGESGIHPMKPELGEALKVAQKNGAVLVADEVQTGIGRTGTFWAHEAYGLQPDVVTSAKALGAGLPLGACLIHEGLADILSPGTHGSTFGGNPVSAAASIALLQQIESQDLLQTVEKRGNQIQTTLQDASVSCRGKGLLWAIPTADPKGFQKELEQEGILVGTAGDAVRISPAYNISKTELASALNAITKSQHAMQQGP